MLFNVIIRLDPDRWSAGPHRLHDQSGPFVCLRGVGCTEDEDHAGRDLEVFFQTQLVFGVLATDFSDPQNVVFGQEFGDHLHHFGKANIFGFWIDIVNSEMVDAVGAGSGGSMEASWLK